MAAQCLQKWLEASGDKAAHDRAIDLDFTDAGRPLDLSFGRRAGKTDFDSLDWMLRDHAPEPGEHAERCHQGNPGAGTEEPVLSGWQQFRSTFGPCPDPPAGQAACPPR